jgi:ankyrin repeat protein/tetratricopeptide (TPR) repeat protein
MGNMRLISAMLVVASLSASGTLPAFPAQQGEENALRRAAREGRTELAAILLERGIDPNVRDEEGDVPLAQAAFLGHIEVVRLLLEHGADVNAANDDGVNALMLAALGGHAEVVEALVAAGADPNARDRDGDTPLGYYAAAQGHIDVVDVLLELGADVNAETDNGWTPLMMAALAGNTEVADLLLEHGADVSAPDEWGATRLMVAARDGQAVVAEWLLDHGADPNARDEDGYPTLGYASLGGYTDVAKLLLEHGADVNAAAMDGWTPLMYAALGGHLELVDLLLEHGADVSAPDQWGRTLLMVAARDGQVGVAEVLLDRGADPNARDVEGGSALMFAAYAGYGDVVRLLLESGADVNAVDQTGWTPLTYAALARDSDLVDLLLEHGADVSAPDEVGTTLLMGAAMLGEIDVVTMLLEAGADPNARDDEGNTALGYYAVHAGHSDVVEVLLEHGADVNAARNDGFTILMYAAVGDDAEVVRWLLERGADVDARSGNANGYEGLTALMLAASEGHTEVTAAVLDAGAEVDAVSGRIPSGDSALTTLMFAAASGHTEVVSRLLRRGANPNASSSRGATPLSLAAATGQGEVAEVLLGQGAEVNAEDESGRTVLMDAALVGHAELVELLLDAGADPNAEDDAGDRPLAYAASEGHVEVANVLLERGADVNAVNHAGATASSLAARYGYAEVVQVLEGAEESSIPSGARETSALAALLPTLADLPRGVTFMEKGSSSYFGGLDGYGRSFQAKGLTFALGSSELIALNTQVELLGDSTEARAAVLVMRAIKAEAWADSLGPYATQLPGFDVERIVAEQVEPPPIGSAAAAARVKVESRMGGLDTYVLFFARDRIFCGVMAIGRSGRVAGDDVVDIARQIDERIRDLPQTVLVGEPAEGVSVSTAARAALQRAEMLAEWGNIAEAIAGYSEAQARDSTLSVSASSWTTLCWYGTLYGRATDVMTACEDAVALDPENGGIRDSRGVARALTGDRHGAIEDLEAFADWTSNAADRGQRQGWIEALRAGEDPFTSEVLESLVAPSPAAGLDETTRRRCLALPAIAVSLEDLTARAVLSREEFAARPEDETCGYEREFGASALTFELSSSQLMYLFTSAQLYSGDAAAMSSVLASEQRFYELRELYADWGFEVDSIVVERLSAPVIGAVSAAWHVRLETGIMDLDVLALLLARGRILTQVTAMGISGPARLEDLIALGKLADARIDSLAPSKLDPETVAALVAVLGEAETFMREGEVGEAMAAYSQALALDSTLAASPLYWDGLCWRGSLWGHAADVMAACEHAVTLAPDNGGVRGSRGLARALLGDREGAIEDLEAFVAWTESDAQAAKRRGWIDSLRAGENPFTAEVLESLRGW